MVPLVLASGSPRRRELLGLLGLAFSVRLAPGEAVPRPGESGPAYAARAAREKALAVREILLVEGAGQAGGAAVLAADTIVLLDGEIFGKPADYEESFAMLRRLAGRAHQVITACCLLLPEGSAATLSLTSRVTFWDAPEEALQAYARSGETLDKAGSYAIQGQGGFMVRRIEGSWSNVVGLPVSELVELMLARGLIAPDLNT
ncbi:MAG: Maf family nucleotide pyrophosphatase [Deltaproteobacteria bacterium]|nr:Maf family nucleotide pyrophosphatase [Deltaproteobacteria bacterium]